MHELKEVSKAKHRILEKYFPAWARILGKYHRLVYVDCFAGAGTYDNNEPGSPIIIYRLAKKLVNENKIKGISLLFIEKDIRSAEQLQKNLEAEDDGNKKIYFNVNHKDAKNFTEILSKIIPPKWPAFFFIDPYGYPMSLPIIKSILKLPKREVLLNLMWFGINRNLENPKTITSITTMFGHSNWQKHPFMQTNSVEREKLFLEYVKAEIDSKFAPDFKIKFSPEEGMGTDRTKYYLIHFSNHPKAMLIMKQIMHGLGDEEGTFDYSADKQGILFSRKPKLSELREYLIKNFCGKSITISFEQLQIDTCDLPSVEKEYRKTIKDMEGEYLDVQRTESQTTGITGKNIIAFY